MTPSTHWSGTSTARFSCRRPTSSSTSRELAMPTWLPVVVDVDRWATDQPLLEREVPVVLHAPSRASLKGSSHVDAAMSALDAAGLIEYRRLEHVAPGADAGRDRRRRHRPGPVRDRKLRSPRRSGYGGGSGRRRPRDARGASGRAVEPSRSSRPPPTTSRRSCGASPPSARQRARRLRRGSLSRARSMTEGARLASCRPCSASAETTGGCPALDLVPWFCVTRVAEGSSEVWPDPVAVRPASRIEGR